MKRATLLILALLLVSCGEKTKPLESVKSAITVEMSPDEDFRAVPDTIKMGTLDQGDIYNGEFTVRNIGEKPLVILSIITGCGCTTTSYDTKPIPPGEDRTISFSFDSKGRMGLQFKTIDLVTNQSLGASVILTGEIGPKK